MIIWDSRIKNIETDIRDNYKELNEKYWELALAHARLLDYLGLDDKHISKHNVIQKKSDK